MFVICSAINGTSNNQISMIGIGWTDVSETSLIRTPHLSFVEQIKNECPGTKREKRSQSKGVTGNGYWCRRLSGSRLTFESRRGFPVGLNACESGACEQEFPSLSSLPIASV